MTRRERLTAKAEKRQEWAAKAEARSDAAFAGVKGIADHIPMGQPILIGHHSEGRHRRDLARIDNGMRKAVEESKLAAHHTEKAAGLEAQLETCIYSDDPDALEALEARIAELEAQRTRWKTENAAFRKGPEAFAALLGVDAEREALLRAKIMSDYSWQRQPHPAYSLQNLGANITRLKKRMEDVRIRQGNTAFAEEKGGCVIAVRSGQAQVVFAEKPERAVLNELKEAGFRWCKGSWFGEESKLPQSVRDFNN
jgi:hypothetical protein